ncbi:MAG: NAD-dependent protein deacylase [Saccharofermentans sp.]|jgi:NAD-dependent deacetylase|nr:NAD-dependent protein deacylase [Mageeibacillus sp.]MCI1263854.1 NAD-dependent protein deacylase [Saccharofermentans sp.]MCI1275356.1 NAD-dependent protein deacylase [Saccharofermentans sp.]MCI1769734.1 NAD-dependent protein deacylase [Mageeibacillus sp.]MCI2043796.1 NAD-dependent protein deacylase [Mageeibacillus sp.]
MEDDYERLNRIVHESSHVVFFGGAGVSTESGIPDFRSKDGLYNQHDVKFDRFSPEYLLSIDCLEENPKVFYEFYRQKLNTAGIEPNGAHIRLAQMEKAGLLDGIITQNIDGLHQRAGSCNVQEIHGSTLRNYCMKCHEKYPSDYIFKSAGDLPRCQRCNGIVRPDVTLYGEGLPRNAWIESKRLVDNADCLIIGGTSLAVQPAASLTYDFRGRYLIVINRDITSRDSDATLVFHESISGVLDKIVI